MVKELAKAYEPKEIEHDLYKWWEENGFFRPEKQRELGLVTDTSERFCITMPPPNVTGVLHLGHAITLSIEDLMTRFARMNQKETLFLPGVDHAGIATQNVVERELRKKGIARKQLGREKFVEKVWEWKHTYHARIKEQTKLMGASCDWKRERFTLDEDMSKAVRHAFVELYNKKLIYRGQYMVNWCPGNCESAISDLEAEPLDIDSFLWYIKYPIETEEWKGPKHEWASGKWAEGAKEFIIVATTRPETLMGDTGVAIAKNHPEYKKYEDKNAVLPVVGRKIPIFVDPYVEADFGTGALKVTPGHDPHDYELSNKHALEIITIFNEKAELLPEHSGKYAGMDRYKCRELLVEDLKKENLLVKIEPYKQTVPTCQRCHTIIEPRISTQWFVQTRGMADKALENVMKLETKMIPEREEQRFNQWMTNIRDWCISRQLWWGHRIPVWYCEKNHQTCSEETPTKCKTCGSTKLTQDEDVLDTWFSSGLWPFSTLGWPNTEHPDFKRFFPTDMRETGYDILFFWVAREMMLSNELANSYPYKTCFFHGIIRNEQGKKISKSMENIDQYDPKNLIEKHGADALRYTLISNTVVGKDMNLNPASVESARHFCNKIWQSTRYVLGNIKEDEKIPTISTKINKKMTPGDKWILSRLNSLIKRCTENIQEYKYLEYSRDFYTFYWEEFCDWYIEMTKVRLYSEDQTIDKTIPKAILLHILEVSYRLIHPVMPYISETLWQALPESMRKVPSISVAEWPKPDEKRILPDIEADFNLVMEIIKKIRNLRTTFNVKPGLRIPAILSTKDKTALLEQFKGEIAELAKLDEAKLQIVGDIDAPKLAGRIVFDGGIVYLPLEGIIDIEKEKQAINTQIEKLTKLIDGQKKKLTGAFIEKAKPEIVEAEKAKLKQNEDKLQQLKEELSMLQ